MVAFPSLGSVAADEGSKGETSRKPGEAYQAIVAEFDKAMQEFMTAYRAAKTDEERQVVFEKYPRAEKYAPRFLAIAEKERGDPAAFDCLIWVARHCRTGQDLEKAIQVLLEDHIRSEKIEQVCLALYFSRNSSTEERLRTILEKSPHPQVQGQATLRLAQYLKPSKAAESERLLELVIEKFGGLAGGEKTLGDQARAELFEIRNLAIGKVAPDIEGEDIEGRRFKLSDERGKVVVLDFWGNW
jgi:hypothetical protein